ncbi:hypothetical protein ALC57_05517, partial [Trachymyrmex cornetzi]
VCRMNIAWYQTSSRTRKILIFMLMKTREPCVLTAGKMFVISMDTFSTVRHILITYIHIIYVYKILIHTYTCIYKNIILKSKKLF